MDYPYTVTNNTHTTERWIVLLQSKISLHMGWESVNYTCPDLITPKQN